MEKLKALVPSFLAMMISAAPSMAATYVISNNPTGTQKSTQWLLEGRFSGANAVPCFNAGDQIRFKRGEVFEGYFTFKACAGSAAGDVLIAGFGTGVRPRILGSVNASSAGYQWSYVSTKTQKGKVIDYLDSVPIYAIDNITTPVIGLIYDDEQMNFARNPNKTDSLRFEPNYYTVENTWLDSPHGCSLSSCVRIRPRSDGSDPLWTFKKYGAQENSYAFIRTSEWSIHGFSIDEIKGDVSGGSSPVTETDRVFRSTSSITGRPGVTLDPNTNNPYTNVPETNLKDYGIILFGGLSLVNIAKEWHYDPEVDRLYFYPPAGERPPSTSKTKIIFAPGDLPPASDGCASTSTPGEARLGVICAIGKSNVGFKIQVVSVEDAANEGIRVINSKSVVVDGVRILRATHHGIRVISNDTFGVNTSLVEVKNSEFRFNGSAVIRVNGPSQTRVIDTLIVKENVISDSGFLNNQPLLADANGDNGVNTSALAGVTFDGRINNVGIRRNAILNSGHSAIIARTPLQSLEISGHESNSPSDTINLSGIDPVRPKIEGYCLLLNDCAGIYINAVGQSPTLSPEIKNNHLMNPRGNNDGSVRPEPVVAGIYIDFAGRNFDIVDNYIEDDHGRLGSIYLNGGQGNSVTGNEIITSTEPHVGFGIYGDPSECKDANAVTQNTVRTSPGGAVIPTVYDYTRSDDPCL